MKRHLAVLTLALCMGGCVAPPTNPAVPFRGFDPVAKLHYSLLDSTRKGPVIAVWFLPDDRNARQMVEFLELLQRTYKEGFSIIGLVVGNDDQTVEAFKKLQPNFPLITDFAGDFAQKYGFKFSPSVILASRDSSTLVRFEGYDAEGLRTLNKALAKEIDKPLTEIDTGTGVQRTAFVWRN